MRAAAATILLLGAGLLTGRALGETVPAALVPTVTVSTPTVTTPITVSTPSITVPISVPTLPAPPVTTTTPVKIPDPIPAPRVPTATTGSAPVGSSSAGPSAPGSSSSPTGSSAAGSSSSPASSASSAGSVSAGPGFNGPGVERIRSSRQWISTTGPKSRRVVTLTFRLSHAGRLFFVVQQVAPSCRTVEHFSVRGHAGRNRSRFPAPASRLRLVPGTYRISAQTRRGLLVQVVTIVVVDHGKPSHDEIAAARAANACSAAGDVAAGKSSTGAASTSRLAASQRGTGVREGTNVRPGGVLGTSLVRAARALEPLLLGLLGLAIALLGIAALPRLAATGSAANEYLERHRIAIAGLGATALAAGVIMFLAG